MPKLPTKIRISFRKITILGRLFLRFLRAMGGAMGGAAEGGMVY
jgi:hypothetical protein